MKIKLQDINKVKKLLENLEIKYNDSLGKCYITALIDTNEEIEEDGFQLELKEKVQYGSSKCKPALIICGENNVHFGYVEDTYSPEFNMRQFLNIQKIKLSNKEKTQIEEIDFIMLDKSNILVSFD